jgi:hypothetical protein
MPKPNLSKILSANVIQSPQDDERFGLDWTKVKLGETVIQLDTKEVFVVINLDELDNPAGYLNLTASALGVTDVIGTSGEIVVTMSGTQATLSLANPLILTGKTVTGGTFNGPTINNAVMVAPALGTPVSGVATNLTGTALGLTAGNVVNAGLTGDVTTVGTVATLATVNGTPGIFGSSSLVPVITVNAKGLITNVGTAAVQPPGNYITALTGDVTATGPGSVAATLATVNGAPGTFGSAALIPIITVNGKGLVTSVTTVAMAAVDAGSLTGSTLAANVVNASLNTITPVGGVLTTVGDFQAWTLGARAGGLLRLWDVNNTDYVHISNPGTSAATAYMQFTVNGTGPVAYRFNTYNGATAVAAVVIAPSGAVALGNNLTIAGNLDFSGTGRRITANFSDAIIANRAMFQTNVVNGATAIIALPNGTNTNAAFRLYSSSDTLNADIFDMAADGANVLIRSYAIGAGTARPIQFQISGTTIATITPTGLAVTGSVTNDPFGIALFTNNHGYWFSSSSARASGVYSTTGSDVIVRAGSADRFIFTAAALTVTVSDIRMTYPGGEPTISQHSSGGSGNQWFLVSRTTGEWTLSNQTFSRHIAASNAGVILYSSGLAVGSFNAAGLTVTGQIAGNTNSPYSLAAAFLNPGQVHNNYTQMYLGRAASEDQCGVMSYYYNSASSGDSYVALDCYGTLGSLKVLGTGLVQVASGLSVIGSISATSGIQIVTPATAGFGVTAATSNIGFSLDHNGGSQFTYLDFSRVLNIRASTSAYATFASLSATSFTVSGTIIANSTSVGAGVPALNGIFNGNNQNGMNIRDNVNSSGAGFIAFQRNDTVVIGSINRVGTTDAIAYNTSSDARLKENVRDFTGDDSGRLIDGLRPRWFNWKDGTGNDIVGFLAQEEHEVDPLFERIGAVTVGDADPFEIKDRWQRSDSNLVPILVAELKSVRTRLQLLEATGRN